MRSGRSIRVRSISNRPNWMCLRPQRSGGADRIDSSFAPPDAFVAAVVDLAVMAAAQRDGELVADLAPEGAALREAQVMGIGRSAAADQAGLLGHIFDVVAVTDPARLRQGECALVD